MKFTPGEWINRGLDDGARVISAEVAGKKRTIAHVYGPTKRNVLNEEIRDGNALLIAAAPELYEAGKALSEFAWTAVEADCTESMEYLNGLINTLREAIAKAEGRK